MTVAMLMENTFLASIRQWEQVRNRKVKPLALNILENVPSDIEIAMAQKPKPVAELATEIGILPNELESYGKYKAKVDLGILDRLAHRKDGKYIIVSGYASLL
jgi:methylenetetrahydrofolate dehydrogenase (NADP+)/methenyltetrahydrofolate cyclohydrolase/formyltetrahydrofolate synthetase